MTPKDVYSLLTTTRYDSSLQNLSWNNDEEGPSPFLLLQYHYHRLMDAAIQHNWQIVPQTFTYETFKSRCNVYITEQFTPGKEKILAMRMRILIGRDGGMSIASSPVKPFDKDPSLPACQALLPLTDDNVIHIRVDVKATKASLFTMTKTTCRDHYDEARERNGIPGLTSPHGSRWDVLLVDENCHILDCTIFNIALHRLGKWITPHSKYGCLPGVFRRWLLEQKLIHEDDNDILVKESLVNGETILLFNGAQGCRMGKILLSAPE